MCHRLRRVRRPVVCSGFQRVGREKLATAHRAHIEEVVATAREVRDVLTPEQLARATTWTARLRRLRAEMHELFGDAEGDGEPAP